MGNKVLVCINWRANPDMPSCGQRGGVEFAEALETEVLAQGLPVAVERFYCLGCCELGPNLKLSPGGEFWHDVHLDDMPRLLARIAAFVQDT